MSFIQSVIVVKGVRVYQGIGMPVGDMGVGVKNGDRFNDLLSKIVYEYENGNWVVSKDNVEAVEGFKNSAENVSLLDIIKLLRGPAGYTPVKGKDYRDGMDGKTPVKGKDYFDGKNGKPGRNGKDAKGGGVTSITDAMIADALSNLSEAVIEGWEPIAQLLELAHDQNGDQGTYEKTFTFNNESDSGQLVIDITEGDLDKKLTLTNEALDDDVIVTIQKKTGTLALKSDIDEAVLGLLDDRGSYDPTSTNKYPATGGSGTAGAIMKGDFWYISKNGSIRGHDVEVGSSVRALVDNAGDSTDADWDILNVGLGYVPENAVNKGTGMAGNESSNIIYLTAKAVYDWAIGLFVKKATPVFTGDVNMVGNYKYYTCVSDTADKKDDVRYYINGFVAIWEKCTADNATKGAGTWVEFARVQGTNTGDQTLPTDATISTTNITTNDASTTKHGWLIKLTAPITGMINYVGIGFGETLASCKALFAANTPTTQAFGDTAVIGTSLTAARDDHKHAMPAAPTLSGLGGMPLAGGTFTGNPILAENVNIQLTALATTNGHATGIVTNAFNSGYTSSAIGDLVYLDSNGAWQKADNTTSVTTYGGMLGIALAVVASGNPLLVALSGSLVYSSAFPTLTVGSPVYMSTAGAVVVAQPNTNNYAIRIIGFATTTKTIYFVPSPDYIVYKT